MASSPTAAQAPPSILENNLDDHSISSNQDINIQQQQPSQDKYLTEFDNESSDIPSMQVNSSNSRNADIAHAQHSSDSRPTHQDNPYQNYQSSTIQPQENSKKPRESESQEVLGDSEHDQNDHDDHDIEAEPTERTSLLKQKSNQPKSSFKRTSSSAKAARKDRFKKDSKRKKSKRTPLILTISFIVSAVLLYINFTFLVLAIFAIRSPIIAHNALPAHFGSLFLPIWYIALSFAVNLTSMISYYSPNLIPRWSSSPASTAFVATCIALLCILFSADLRRKENTFTNIVGGIFLLSLIENALTFRLVNHHKKDIVADAIENESNNHPTFSTKIGHFFRKFTSLVFVKVPLQAVYFSVAVFSILLSLNVIGRSYDGSLIPDGQIWEVNPWVQTNGENLWDIGGRPVRIHVSCRDVIDPHLPPSEPGEGHFSPNISTASPPYMRPVRTIIAEAPQGYPGEPSSQWIANLIEQGKIATGDYTVRFCFWDRPGHGFSDTMPTSSIAHVSTALWQALSDGGEVARIKQSRYPPYGIATSDEEYDNSRDEEGVLRKHNPEAGFVLVGDGYGALVSSMFAGRHPDLIVSFLYLSPLVPQVAYEPVPFNSWKVFFKHSLVQWFKVNLYGWFFTELGIWRWISVFIDKSSREDRFLSPFTDFIRGEEVRAHIQEYAEIGTADSISARTWDRVVVSYPRRPTIVLSTKASHEPSRDPMFPPDYWYDAQRNFVGETIGSGLIYWESTWSGSCEDTSENAEGFKLCKSALKEVLLN